LKALRGNPGKRRLKHEPEPAAASITCPTWLELEAAEEWARIAPELERLGLLTVVDIPALAGYCVAYQRWREAERAVKATVAAGGLALAISQGIEGMARARLKLMKLLAAEFGFTPSSRSRVSVKAPEAEDPFAQFGGLQGIDGGRGRGGSR
jgi:P27 family predicted phage terminase small subunit